ncbi:MAG: hypothetical protein HY902_06600 [Deltaproteobacteria bacterium]|nr:hypothetical protein [Deltaproteobacteria bacterium]
MLAALIGRDGGTAAPDARDTRLFKVDKSNHVLGVASHLIPHMALQLASLTMDQPQFWPDEVVRARLLMPGRGGSKCKLSWAKRDGTPRDVDVQLDDAGLAVVQLQDGRAQKLDLGEYRVDVATADGKIKTSTTFAVVEGQLGALSFAYSFERLTAAEQLEKVKAGWFLGNAAGVGQRWGNGLSFKNQLRVDNQPYEGEVEVIPRCMLSGCNGVVAGPRQKLQVRGGELAGTIAIGGHSGPFQIEVITPQGSLRYQFEGSGHVERELIPVSKGVRYAHQVTLAPYEGTQQLPGRALWTVRKAGTAEQDSFEVESLVATDGKLTVQVRHDVDRAVAMVWRADKNGGYVSQQPELTSKILAGTVLRIEVGHGPALVSVGGVAQSGPNKGRFVEGYAFAFPPPDVQAKILVPEKSRPNSEVTVQLQAQDRAGQPLAVSGILEAYDIRVAAKDPAGPLNSAVGDSLRSAGRHLDGWVDPVELERQRKEEERRAREEERREREAERQAARDEAKAKKNGEVVAHGRGYGYASGGAAAAPKAMAMEMKMSAPRMGRPAGAPPSPHGGDHADDEDGEVVREGEIKVTFVAVVRTDATGKVSVQVPTPPQTGRLGLRWTPVRDLAWVTAEAQTDLARQAWVEAQAPRAIVAGGELELRVVTHNQQQRPMFLQLSGAGFPAPVQRPVASGVQTQLLAWPAVPGTIELALVDDAGQTHDRRKLPVADVARQPVTWSRLEVGGAGRITVQPGEKLVVYGGPGPLLRGIVTNVVTTMESWFPHAEALSAQVATRVTLLAAIDRNLLKDDGYRQQLFSGFDHAMTQLDALYDAGSQQVRPWTGMAPSPRWTAWVASNLQIARRAVKYAPGLCNQAPDACKRLDALARHLDQGFAARKQKPSEVAGYDETQDGLEVVPVEVDGQVIFRAVTDDAVQRFALDKLGPALGDLDGGDPLALGKALDTFRFLRAFERVGKLQWLMGQAKAAWAAGEAGKPTFDKLFGVIARGMVLSQEPGMLQGPALLGGVYSQPAALPRFIDLLLMMGARPVEQGAVKLNMGGKTVTIKYGEVVAVAQRADLAVPRGGMARIDRPGTVDLRAASEKRFAKVAVEHAQLAVGEQSRIRIELDADKDPLEYYALVAVPATVAIRQTEDALSDYKGQLIYGQQSMGSAKMQIIAVPFRGSRTLTLWIEGLTGGHAPGVVAIRHVHDPAEWCSLVIPEITVRSAPQGAQPAQIRSTQAILAPAQRRPR